MNIDDCGINFPAELLVHCLNFVPDLQACSQVNSSWRGAVIDITARRLNELAKDVYQSLALPYRPNRELFKARLAKNAAAQSFAEISANEPEIKKLFLSHFRHLSIEELVTAAQLEDLLPNPFFNIEEVKLEAIINGYQRVLAKIDQGDGLRREANRATVLLKVADSLAALSIPQSIEEMEKLLSYYPFNEQPKETSSFDPMDTLFELPKKSALSTKISQKFLAQGNLEKSVHYALLAEKSSSFNLIPELFVELFQKEREDLAIFFASQATNYSRQQAFFTLAQHFFRKGLLAEGFEFAKEVTLSPLKKRLESDKKRSLPPPAD